METPEVSAKPSEEEKHGGVGWGGEGTRRPRHPRAKNHSVNRSTHDVSGGKEADAYTEE